MNKKLIFSFVLTLLLTSIGSAAIRVVDQVSGPYYNIRGAIADACSGDTVELADGTYAGSNNRDLDFGGKLITVRSASGNPNNCIIDCGNAGRGFYFHSGETPAATVEGITIKNGDEYYGGAIECEDASPTINNCIITDSTAVYGGAIDCFYASPVINNCIIAGNISYYDGGAIECSSESSPDITNCLITDNNSLNGYGAIDCYDYSSPAIINCTIADNTGSGSFGGVYASYGSSSTVRNSILWNNGDDIYGPTTLTYSCIQDGDTGTGNINTDPLLKTGPWGNYYLSQIAAGQLAPNSPCIDTGGDSNDTIFGSGHSFTTRTDNIPDSNTVDMGFHYPDSGIDANYVLTTGVDPNGNPGTVTPSPNLPSYTQFSEVLLTANPTDPNDYIEKWIIDGNDVSDTNTTRLITMDANHTVTATFAPSICKLITLVYGGNGTINPNYPPTGASFPKNSQITINAYPTDPNIYGVNRWLKGRTATFDINDPNTYTVIYGPNTTYIVTLDSGTTVAVEFGKFMLDTRVIILPDGQKHGTISPGRYYQPARKTVTITATLESGYRVKQWTDDADNKPASDVNTNTVTMTSNKLVKVEFELIPQFTLTTNAASGTTIDPNYPTGQLFNESTIVPLTATIPLDSVVIWSGTDDNNTIELTNTVTMDANHTVNVSYHIPRVLHVPGQYLCIQDAIDDANDGDTIQIAPGTYIATGFWVYNKSITIIGDPENPETVVIDGSGEDSLRGPLGFQIVGTGTSVLNGITIANIDLYSGDGFGSNEPSFPGQGGGWNGGLGLYIGGDHQVLNCIIRNINSRSGTGGDGADGNSTIHNGSFGGDGGTVYGAGVIILGGSPVFKNTIIEDCCAVGGIGGNGANGYSYSSDTEPNNGDAGQGGLGGGAFGGGISIIDDNDLPLWMTYGLPPLTLPRPTFENCTIRNCFAKGGQGGNGGLAGFNFPDPCSYGGLTTVSRAGQGDIVSNNSARGGAVYVGWGCNATFINCIITDNATEGSISGLGGISYYGTQQQPNKNYHLPSFGAGVFCDVNSNVKFSDCNMQNNETISTNVGETVISDDSDCSGGGGLSLWYANIAEVNDCKFIQNSAPIGGGIYSLWTDLHVTECNIINNNSYSGGGILAMDSIVEITKSSVKGNTAGTQSGTVEDTGYALFGSGGGIYALSSLIDINDTAITENYARMTGGGICLDGDTMFLQKPLIKNCLITNNNAADSGGGIASTFFAKPTIQNCTLADNSVTDTNSNGGGLFCSYESDTIVKDSIFWNNSGMDGSQIALSDGGFFTDMPSSLTITYSDIDLRYGSGLDPNESDSGSSGSTSIPKLVDEQTIYDEINSSGSAKIIISLVEPAEAQTTDWSSPDSVSTLQSQIATLQDQALSTVTPSEFTLRHKLTNVAAFSGTATSTGLSKLLVSSVVAHIEPVRTVYPMTAQGIPLMNALNTRATYNGQGVSIAIVDTGVDYTHPRLGGGTFPNSKVIGGYDTGSDDADPIPVGVAHGTACAGIAAGSLGTVGDYIGGGAYNAKIYALKASPDNAGYFFSADILAAWDWCISHRNDNLADPIKAISNSLGGGYYSSSAAADNDYPAFAIAAATANSAGITILASSGNNGFTDGISWPAAMSDVISVGAVYDATFYSQNCYVQTQPDGVTCYSNTAGILDILAPSENAYTTDIVGTGGYNTGDYYQYFNGTSAACPYAAGAVAALQNAAKQITGAYLTPAQVKAALTASGNPVTDTRIAITKPRVNVSAAISMLGTSVPVYTERSCTITGLQKDANDMWTAAGSSNIAEDPNFVPGINYYLSHIDALQVYTSPCFDIGSALAANLSLDSYTTRVDNFKDIGIVDLGYHYSEGITRRYELTVDVNDPAYGTIKAPWLAGYTYNIYAGQIITLEAVPDANCKVANWFVDDVGQQTDSNNFITTMDRSKKVTVSFGLVTDDPSQLQDEIHVPTDYPDLGSAINAAVSGDTIILATGTYSLSESNFDYSTILINGKNITITSSAPDDPCIIAQTIILGNGFTILDVDRTMTIEGVTIQDAHYYAGFLDCSATWAHSDPGGDGYNGFTILGGAMRLYNASPTIRNCRFINCSALGANGCDGSGEAGDGGWAGWAHGGAIGIDETSNPLVKNCNFIDCYVQGGNGGNGVNGDPGGHGGNWGDPLSSRWDFGPYEPYWYYSGKGGAIYCASGSKPVFESCLFQGNVAYSGTSGISDVDYSGWPHYNYAIPSFGGAVYIARGSEAKFTDCVFIDNEADTRGQIGDVNLPDGATLYSPVVSYGGAICTENTGVEDAEDATQIIENCTFINNRACSGGGIYQKGATAYLVNNTFESCISMIGGGMAMVNNSSFIVDCYFGNNQAIGPAGQGGAIYSSSDAMFYDCQIYSNTAEVSGGGAYFTSNSEPNMHNCLITSNNASRDGAGVSANWNAELTLSNCTITNNTVSGTGFASDYGGGLSCAYEAYTKVVNSILWNNNAEYGSEISIGNTFDAADKHGARVDVSYSDVRDGQAGIFADTENGCILDWNTGNFNGTSLESPLFVIGPWGNYYLSQLATSDPCQTVDSPCVDAGYGSAVDNSMYKHTTRTDHIIDVADSNVDMGYHYTLIADLLGDLNFDGILTIEDLGLFMLCWLDDGCSFPYFCSGRDLNKDGRVDFEDFALFAENYGKTETVPPRPNPMTWALSPRSAGLNSITMRATAARDNSSTIIEYYFECTSGGGNNRGWSVDTTYTNTGLTPGQQYGYQVKARDAKYNETDWSVIGYAEPNEDRTPPKPDPMTWVTAPYVTSSDSIRMVATTATDISGVEYWFEETSGNAGGTSSGWQDDPNYEDIGLLPSTPYTYRVMARDKSSNQNSTSYSDSASATTEPTEDTTPPNPNPSQWAAGGTPIYTYDGQFYYHTMTAVEANDVSPPVYYYFECTNGAGTSSNWQLSPTWIAGPYLVPNYSVYRVYARDSAVPESNTGSPSPKYDTNGYLVP
ncbi:MAG: S8 family serine peptidase [Planctomycetes bacterium]|nr:S8 family serine peptidase [Planctomycetota bacterium]